MRGSVAGWVLVASLATLLQPVGAQGDGPVVVGVLDTGVDGRHSELDGKVTRSSFVAPSLPLPVGFDLGQALPDLDGQGTGVASLVAGDTLGLAPNATILDLQVRLSRSPDVDTDAEQAAIRALDQVLRTPGPRVMVLSFAASGVSEEGASTLAEQAAGLWEMGILTVVPTGPGSSALHASPHVLTVAGIEECPAEGVKVDLVAPTQGLAVAAAPGTPEQTRMAWGTAYAAAQVAGAAALLWGERPDLTQDEVSALLRRHAADRGEPGFDACTGFGLLDANATLLAARSFSDPFPPEADEPRRSVPGLPALLPVAALLPLAARRRM